MPTQQILLGAGGESITGGQTTALGGRDAYHGGTGAMTPSCTNSGTGSPTIAMGTKGGSAGNSYSNIYSWVCPSDVNYISVVVAGAGGGGGGGQIVDYYVPYVGDIYHKYTGGGGGGGGLAYINGLAVTPGTTYYLAVGWGAAAVAGNNSGYLGGPSWFATGYTGGSGTTPYSPTGSSLYANGGQGGTYSSSRAVGGTAFATTWTATAAYSGGYGGYAYNGGSNELGGGGGGGAAGYSGVGGNGSSFQSETSYTNATAGAGGGAGGGGGFYQHPTGGGGIGYLGEGSSGAAGVRTVTGTVASHPNYLSSEFGQAGSGGSIGVEYNNTGTNFDYGTKTTAGIYGGGGRGNDGRANPGPGSPGFVRILWDSDNQGTHRTYPSTNTGDMS